MMKYKALKRKPMTETELRVMKVAFRSMEDVKDAIGDIVEIALEKLTLRRVKAWEHVAELLGEDYPQMDPARSLRIDWARGELQLLEELGGRRECFGDGKIILDNVPVDDGPAEE